MSSDILMQGLIYLLPSLLFFGAAFVVATDKKMGERWANLLHQMGSIKADQRSDPEIQRSVRKPFFIIAALLLILPIRHMFWVVPNARSVAVVDESAKLSKPHLEADPTKKPAKSEATPTPTRDPSAGPTLPPLPGEKPAQPGAPPPGAPAAPSVPGAPPKPGAPHL